MHVAARRSHRSQARGSRPRINVCDGPPWISPLTVRDLRRRAHRPQVLLLRRRRLRLELCEGEAAPRVKVRVARLRPQQRARRERALLELGHVRVRGPPDTRRRCVRALRAARTSGARVAQGVARVVLAVADARAVAEHASARACALRCLVGEHTGCRARVAARCRVHPLSRCCRCRSVARAVLRLSPSICAVSGQALPLVSSRPTAAAAPPLRGSPRPAPAPRSASLDAEEGLCVVVLRRLLRHRCSSCCSAIKQGAAAVRCGGGADRLQPLRHRRRCCYCCSCTSRSRSELSSEPRRASDTAWIEAAQGTRETRRHAEAQCGCGIISC